MSLLCSLSQYFHLRLLVVLKASTLFFELLNLSIISNSFNSIEAVLKFYVCMQHYTCLQLVLRRINSSSIDISLKPNF